MLRLNHITFAADKPQRLAEFWSEVLDGYSAEAAGDSWLSSGDGPSLFFNRMEKSPTLELPIQRPDVLVPVVELFLKD